MFNYKTGRTLYDVIRNNCFSPAVTIYKCPTVANRMINSYLNTIFNSFQPKYNVQNNLERSPRVFKKVDDVH